MCCRPPHWDVATCRNYLQISSTSHSGHNSFTPLINGTPVTGIHVSSSLTEDTVTVMKLDWLMLFREVIAIYCKKHVKQIHVGGMQLPSSTACGLCTYQ